MRECIVCGGELEQDSIVAREMMYGTKREFTYCICKECGCMQIANVPDELGEYYKNNYYSYKTPEIKKNLPKTEATRVLDVGCGAGTLLCSLREGGLYNLFGCDPFINEDIEYENGVKIYKKTIHEMQGEFDWIYMNDSFEHMYDANEVMESVHRLLSPNGICRIKIPVFPNIAWDMFKTDWYQLDAPRHLILHSVNSMRYLIKEHDLELIKIEYDSNAWQIISSYLYSLDIPLVEHSLDVARTYFSDEELLDIAENSKEANEKQYGDHAIFYIKNKNTIKK